MATFKLYFAASGELDHLAELASHQKIGFYGNEYGDTITVGTYQTSLHMINTDNSDYCKYGGGDGKGRAIDTLQYLTSDTCEHFGVISSGVMDVVNVEELSCMKYVFSHDSAVSCSGAKFYAYESPTTTDPPIGVACWAFEKGDSAWSNASGLNNALELADQTAPATSHNYYIGVSAGPTTVGAKTNWKLRLDLTYY